MSNDHIRRIADDEMKSIHDIAQFSYLSGCSTHENGDGTPFHKSIAASNLIIIELLQRLLERG